MIKIEILDEFENTQELITTMKEITEKLEEGYVSGHYPTWNTTGEAEPEPEDPDEPLPPGSNLLGPLGTEPATA